MDTDTLKTRLAQLAEGAAWRDADKTQQDTCMAALQYIKEAEAREAGGIQRPIALPDGQEAYPLDLRKGLKAEFLHHLSGVLTGRRDPSAQLALVSDDPEAGKQVAPEQIEQVTAECLSLMQMFGVVQGGGEAPKE